MELQQFTAGPHPSAADFEAKALSAAGSDWVFGAQHSPFDCSPGISDAGWQQDGFVSFVLVSLLQHKPPFGVGVPDEQHPSFFIPFCAAHEQ